jgi:hypothetical protein
MQALFLRHSFALDCHDTRLPFPLSQLTHDGFFHEPSNAHLVYRILETESWIARHSSIRPWTAELKTKRRLGHIVRGEGLHDNAFQLSL